MKQTIKKVTKNKLAILSPSNISTTANFSGDVENYKVMLNEMAELKGEREKLLGKCKTFMRKYLKDKPYEGTELSSLIDKLTVYKPQDKIEASDKAKRLVKHLQYNVVEWNDNRAFMTMFNSDFGPKAFKLVEEASAYYHTQNDEKIVDEEATAKIRKEFEDMTNKYDEIEISIKSQEIKVKQIKEYVSLYKDLASIASVNDRKRK
jgi:hypothetical protein